MENSESKNKQALTRNYVNQNIFKITNEEVESEIFKESIITDHIKINGGTAYVTQNYDLKMLILPSSSYAVAKENLIPAYKLLKYTQNFSKIKTIFLIGYSHLALKQCIYFSAYNYYQTNNTKKSFEIDQSIYSEIMKNETIKKYCEKFEINSYTNTIFIEEGGYITDKEVEYNESIEDNEFTFDIHLALINHLFNEQKIKIVPIWINLNCVNYPNSKDALLELGQILSQYLAKDENLFLYSTNLTYFGRIYNYFGDNKSEHKEFRSKSFLREKKNEEKIVSYIKSIDEEGLNAIRNKDADALLKISNFNYSRELLATLIYTIKKTELNIDVLNYYVKRYENIEEGFELNMVSFVTIILYNKI